MENILKIKEENINKACIWNELTNVYSLSKTLRFELRPQGKTFVFIKEKGLIEEDKQRDKEFLEIKKIIDKYLAYFIERNLSEDKNLVEEHQLKEIQEVYEKLKKNPKDDNLKKEYASLQSELRKSIYKQIETKGQYNNFFGKDFIKKVLLEYYKDDKDKFYLLKKFERWNTYFTGFYDNRKNIFTEKDISTSLTYRIVNDNLPKFLDNINRYKQLKEKLPIQKIEEEFKEYLNEMPLNVFFSLYNFQNCLNQTGIDKFNLIIGGRSPDGEKKIQGVNEYINKLAQDEKDKNESKKIRKLKMLPLFKQMLSERQSNSFQFEKIDYDKDLIEKIDTFNLELEKNNIFKKLKELFLNLEENDLKEIYIKSGKNLTLISQHLFGDWERLNKGIEEYAQEKYPRKQERDKWLKSKFFSIYDLEESIERLKISTEFDKELYDNYLKKINNNFKHPICGFLSQLNEKELDLIENINNFYNKYLEVSQKDFKEGEKNLLKEEFEKDNEKIKLYLDSLKDLLHFISPLYLNSSSEDSKEQEVFEIDAHFYETFNELYFKLKEVIPIYNQVRNYITQKPFSSKKFKLNFENSTLLNGWDKNKERDNFSVIFRKENKFGFYEYFLGIMSMGNNKIFLNIDESNEESCFEKMEYKLLPGPDKMLPKVFFSKTNIDFYSPSQEILNIRNSSSHTKGGKAQEGFNKKEFNLSDCHKMIDFYKESLEKHPEWNNFNFKFKETSEYKDTSEFFKEISDQGYQIKFKLFSNNYINQLVDEGKLYLFQIYNKDFSSYSKGKKNLHTIYWEELFSEENLKDVVYKLNGEAEIFYREKSINKTNPTHPKNEEINNKNPLNPKKISKFDYDLIKDKRYTQDKFLFHCPITLNFKAKGSKWDINKIVNKTIKENSLDVNILSIDRGERHLAYWTLLNSKGDILNQGSFNKIENDIKNKEIKITTDYHKELDKKEVSRDEARKNWKKIENIKELKEGYLSQVVHKLAKLAVEENAIIVFEDLNFGFKRGRFKIEKQVYQKFEKMLIEKFNYLVFKDREKEDLAGSLKALQLTPSIASEKEKGKQTGVIFYVDPNYTSKIDPKTGFINLLNQKYESVEKAKNFFKKFKEVKYNGEYFEFTFDYTKFFDKYTIKKKEWTICSYGERISSFRNPDKNNNYDSKLIYPTEELKDLFDEFVIEYKNNTNILEEIISQDSKDFFKPLLFLLSKILQLRNSIPNTEEDFILSCVKDKNGNLFDSRNAKETEPKNADSNGAYNIGIKGLMLINKIKNTQEDKKVDLKITRDEFVNYLIERNK